MGTFGQVGKVDDDEDDDDDDDDDDEDGMYHLLNLSVPPHHI